MSVRSLEAALVSSDTRLVDFYATVFGLSVLEPRSTERVTVHRLGHDRALIKIAVPRQPPTIAPSEPGAPFWARSGLAYLTLWVDDVDAVAERFTNAGGSVLSGPVEVRPGVRIAMVRDPEGNALEIVQDTSVGS